MSTLPFKEIFRLSQIAHDLQDRVDAYMTGSSNIETFLNKYFTPSQVKHFRHLQSRNQMIISGSAALQFFEGVTYPNSDLDIYVEDTHKEEIVGWLVRRGYIFNSLRNMTLEEEMASPPPPEDTISHISDAFGYFGRGVTNVYNFSKGNAGPRIQLITTSFAPIRVILNFHSTCVMNIITHQKAYALFPKATFVDHRSLNRPTGGVDQDPACQKYADRGWTMIDRLSAAERVNSEFTNKPRYPGDSFCWTIKLLPEMALRESLIEVNSWTFHCEREVPLVATWYISDEEVDFKYIIGDHEEHRLVIKALDEFKEVGARHQDARILELVRAERLTQ